MNHKLWSSVGARVLAVSFLLAGVTACGERISNTSTRTPPATAASSSTVLVGTAPAQPSGDPPGTTPVSGDTKELTKTEESRKMPVEGQDSSHFSESKVDSQRTGKTDEQTQRRPQ